MEIYIEYCIKWNYGPEFDRVSKIIKDINPKASIVGNPEPPRSGSFEITINGNLVFSKFLKNKFPTYEIIYEILKG